MKETNIFASDIIRKMKQENRQLKMTVLLSLIVNLMLVLVIFFK